MSTSLHVFAEGLRTLLAAPSAERLEADWARLDIAERGWDALAAVERSTDPAVVPVLDETDGLLLRLLDRLPHHPGGVAQAHVLAFRLPALERLQHATAAALVAHRYGTAGLATVAVDRRAPVPRRYHAFRLLARLHAPQSWPLFERYLTPEAHHAFLGVATEATRYYPEARPAAALVALFESVRSDLHLRAFLSPRLLGSLYVLRDPVAVPLYRGLVVAGHTDADPRRCEVTHALIMLRRLTGTVPPSVKFPGGCGADTQWLDAAEARVREDRDVLRPVAVI